MKQLFTVFVFIFTLVAGAFAAAENVSVDITKLDANQLKVYQEFKQLQAKTAASTALENLTPEKVDRYAQMGKGLGVAINEGLSAVTKNVETFSQTSAGKWLMVLITWKVMGEDAIGLARTAVQWAVGGTLMLVGVPFWIWLVRRNCVQRPIATVERTGFFKRKVTYQDRSEPIHSEWIIAYGACFLIYMGMCALITFIH
jgi:hypothetical protein